MRIFIALNLPKKERERIHRAARALRLAAHLPEVRETAQRQLDIEEDELVRRELRTLLAR